MSHKHGIMTPARTGSYRKDAITIAVSLAIGCTVLASPAASQSITDRFKSLFGGQPDEPAQTGAPTSPPGGEPDLTCPDVKIRAGASTFAVGLPGKPATGSDLRYQATITKTARDCNLENGIITARIGIQGRVIAGPAWNPGTVEVPVRVAVVQGGVTEKTIATKAIQTAVPMNESTNVPFSVVVEDLVYPAPTAAANDSYIFYIGFDPQALKPEPKPRAPKKK
jgi:hypothetical protein